MQHCCLANIVKATPDHSGGGNSQPHLTLRQSPHQTYWATICDIHAPVIPCWSVFISSHAVARFGWNYIQLADGIAARINTFAHHMKPPTSQLKLNSAFRTSHALRRTHMSHTFMRRHRTQHYRLLVWAKRHPRMPSLRVRVWCFGCSAQDK